MKQNENFLRADEVKPGFEMEFTYIGKELRKAKTGTEYPMWQIRDDNGNLFSTSEWAIFADGKNNNRDPDKGERITLRKSPVAKKFLLTYPEKITEEIV